MRLIVPVLSYSDRSKAINAIYDRYADVTATAFKTYRKQYYHDRDGALRIEDFLQYGLSFTDKYYNEIDDEGQRMKYLSGRMLDMIHTIDLTHSRKISYKSTISVESLEKISVPLLLLSIFVAFTAGSMFNESFGDGVKDAVNIIVLTVILISTLYIIWPTLFRRNKK